MDIDVTIGNDVTMRGGTASALGRIDQYELVRELGGGGFGTVFLARDMVAGIDVAVKGLPPLVRNNKEELENIRQNFALVSRLHHPHIAAALVLHPAKAVAYAARAVAEKLRVFEGDFLVVMEYAPGVTLSQWRKQFPNGKVPAEKALSIVRQVADALDYAHAQKIIHRDIKPANVMIETKSDRAVVARVLDFGLAAEVRSSMGRVSRQITDTSGTRPYMAPEQWLGRKQNAATDQYALAALACELLTGEVPFASAFETGDPVVMMNVVGRETPELSPDLKRSMRKALATALAKEPEKRFESCTAFAAALSSDGRARTPRIAPASQLASLGGYPAAPLKWIAASVILLTLVAVGGWWVWKTQREAEAARQAEIARQQEASRIVAEKAEIERQRAEELRLAEEMRLAEERRLAEEKRKAEEKRREAAARAAEEAAKAEEARKMAEEKRLAELARQRDEEEKRRKDEAAARAAEEAAKAEAARKIAEEKRLAEEARSKSTESAVRAFAIGDWQQGRRLLADGNANDPRLLYWQGVCAEKGHGEAADETRAVEFFRRAAEAGNADAQHKWGLMKFFGRSVEKNVADAMVLNIKAAEQGNVKAQKFLAIQWEAGTVVPRNMEKAERWYRKAAENGDAYAKQWLEKKGK